MIGSDDLAYLKARILPVLSRDEERDVIRRAQKGDKGALDRLVRGNIALAITVAKKQVGVGDQLADLVQEALAGISVAVERFELKRKLRFSTYASWWVKAFVSRKAREGRSIVRRPAVQWGKYEPIGTPSSRYIREDKSLDAPVVLGGDELETTYLDLVESDGEPPDEASFRGSLSDKVRARLALYRRRLGPVACDVLDHRLMADPGDELTLEQIGDEHELSRERVRQIEAKTKQFLVGVLADLHDDEEPAPDAPRRVLTNMVGAKPGGKCRECGADLFTRRIKLGLCVKHDGSAKEPAEPAEVEEHTRMLKKAQEAERKPQLAAPAPVAPADWRTAEEIAQEAKEKAPPSPVPSTLPPPENLPIGYVYEILRWVKKQRLEIDGEGS